MFDFFTLIYHFSEWICTLAIFFIFRYHYELMGYNTVDVLQSFYFFDAWIVSSVACGSIFKLGLCPFDTTPVVSDKMVSDKRWSTLIFYTTWLKPGKQPFFFFNYCWFPFIEKWYLEVIDWELWSLLCWVLLLLLAFLMDKIRNT